MTQLVKQGWKVVIIHKEQGRSVISAQPSQKQELGAHSKKGMSFEMGREDSAAGKATV